MAFTPVKFTRDGEETTAKTATDYWQLVWEGWRASVGLTPPRNVTSAKQTDLDDLEARIASSFVARWKPTTAYAAGDTVVAPDGSLVKAKAAFTSGTTYDATKWSSAAALLDGNGTVDPAQIPRSLTARDSFGLGAGRGSARNPFYVNQSLNAALIQNALAAGGGDDYVGSQINIKFEGDFSQHIRSLTGSITAGQTAVTLTGGAFAAPIKVGDYVHIPGAGPGGLPFKSRIQTITDTTHATLYDAASTSVVGVAMQSSVAADPAFIFGANDFFTTGTQSNDLVGIDHLYGRLTEVHLYTPGRTLSSARTMQVDGGVEASAVGTTVGAFTAMLLHSVSQRAPYTTRTVTDAATTTASTTLTSATAAFTAADVGRVVLGTGISRGTKIVSVTNGTTVVLSRGARRTNTGLTVEIFTPVIDTAYDHWIEGVQRPGVRDHYALYVENGGRSKLGPTLLYGSKTDDVALTLQAPLNPVLPVLEVFDVTGTNRVAHLDANGGFGSGLGFTAYEGLAAQTTVGAMGNGKSGIRFGSGSNEIRLNATSTALEATLPVQTTRSVTGSRPSAATATQGAQHFDTTLNKPIWSDGTNWRDAAGTIV